MAALRLPLTLILVISLAAAPVFAGPPRPTAKATAADAKAPADKPADAKAADAKPAGTKAADAKAADTKAAADGGAAADGAAAAPTTPVEPPPPPKPGHLVIVADDDNFVAQFAGALHGLKKGSNRFEVKAGDYTIEVKTKKGAKVASYSAKVQPEKDTTVKVVTTGTLQLNVADGGSLEVDGEKIKAKGDVATATVKAGKHSVVVKRPGYFGTKGDVAVMAGSRLAIDPAMEQFKGQDPTLAWVGILGGGALVLTAVAMEIFVDATAAGGDATRWALVGFGTAGFVGGTMMMKDIIKAENNPPVHEGKIKTKVASSGKKISFAFRF